MKTRVIVDTDTGIDDAMGCGLALRSPELEVMAFTTVFGNEDIDKVTDNTAYLMEVFGCPHIPLGKGAARGIHGRAPIYSPFVHGADGIGDTGFNQPKVVKPVEQSAAALIVEMALRHPKELTFIALGPLTNLALALALRPDLPEFLPRVVWMGGAVRVPGNVTPVAEADSWHDPEAAELVYQKPGWDVVQVGLDVTDDTTLEEEDRERLKAGGAEARYMADIMPFYMRFYSGRFKRLACAAHSALTVAVVADPAIVKSSERLRIHVETGGQFSAGMTIADLRLNSGAQSETWSNAPMINVVTEVDRPRFKELFISRMGA